jgi:threonine dehydratase
MRTVLAPTRDDVLAAEQRIRPYLRPTPLVESDGFALKLETFQPTGSFKVRGALAALTALAEPVVCASAGNHGLSWASTRRSWSPRRRRRRRSTRSAGSP